MKDFFLLIITTCIALLFMKFHQNRAILCSACVGAKNSLILFSLIRYTVAPLGRGRTIGNISCISAAPRLVQCHLSVVSSCQRSNAVGLECAIILTRPPVQHNSTYRNSYTRGKHYKKLIEVCMQYHKLIYKYELSMI